jgi:DNA-binding transcriptional MerR regulator
MTASKKLKAKELKGFQSVALKGRSLRDRVYTVPELITVTGLNRRRIRYWEKIGFLRPSFKDIKARGSKPVSYYSAESIVRALIICEMTHRGLSLKQVRKIEDNLRRKHLRLAESAKYLVTDGVTAYYAANENKVVDILRHEKQMILIPVWEKMIKMREKIRVIKVA